MLNPYFVRASRLDLFTQIGVKRFGPNHTVGGADGRLIRHNPITPVEACCRSELAFGSVAQVSDTVVSGFDLGVLARDNFSHRRRQTVI